MIKKKYPVETAKQIVKRYCLLQERCKKDVMEKINELDLTREQKEILINFVIKKDYLNEVRFTKSFCRGKFRMKNWGRIKIINQLKQKNISIMNIEKGLTEINNTEYLTVIDKLIKKKKKTITAETDYIINNKTANFLIQKGFESFLVWDRIKNIKL